MRLLKGLRQWVAHLLLLGQETCPTISEDHRSQAIEGLLAVLTPLLYLLPLCLQLGQGAGHRPTWGAQQS